MNQKSLDKNKTSEIFEGVNSTLHQAFVKAVERDKNKTKELVDYASKLSLYGKITEQHAKDINEILNDMFTQQRTELLEEIDKMELKHSINPNSPSRERKIIYNQAIMDVINLLNNKDE